jgi:hypothetical protein
MHYSITTEHCCCQNVLIRYFYFSYFARIPQYDGSFFQAGSDDPCFEQDKQQETYDVLHGPVHQQSQETKGSHFTF